MSHPFCLYASSRAIRSPASAITPPKPGPVSYSKTSGGVFDCSLVWITWRCSSIGTASRSRVYLGFASWNPSTCISMSARSWLVVSGAEAKNLMVWPPPWLPPPQAAVPKSAAPASPAPPSLKKSLRLTGLLRILRTLSSFALPSLASPRRRVRSSLPRARLLQHPFRREDAGPCDAGHPVELAQYHGQIPGRERERSAVDGAPYLGQQRVPYVGHAAAHDHQRRVERADEGGEHPAHDPARLPDDVERVMVPEGCRSPDVPGVEPAPLLQPLPEGRRRPAPRAPLRLGGYGGGRGHSLQAPPVAARADGAIGVHADVPDVPRAPLSPAVEPSVRDDRAPNPGPYLDEEQVVHALPHPAPVLAEGHHVDVVVHEDRGRVLVGEDAPYGVAVPSRHDRGALEQPRSLLDRPRHTHPDRQDVSRPRPL